MRNVIIIGPPASGKLTIAKALAEAKGYFLFDNHRSLDAVEILTVEQQTHPKELLHSIRKSVFQVAADSKTPIVFTMVFGHSIDENIMREYSSILSKYEPPLIVQLHCTRSDSLLRCKDISRVGTTKLIKPKQIEELYSMYDMESDYLPSSENMLHINTSITSVEESIEIIVGRI